MSSLILVITGVLGVTLTFYVSEDLQQGNVRASALLSLLVGLFFYFFPEVLSAYLTKNIPLVFIGTSFIGMVSSKALKSYLKLALSGALFSVIFIYGSRYFDGYGGSLGALALISLLVVLSFSGLLRNGLKKKDQHSKNGLS